MGKGKKGSKSVSSSGKKVQIDDGKKSSKQPHDERADASGSHSKAISSEHSVESSGCIIPAEPGCVVGRPIDPSKPGDAELVTCSNKGCTENLYMHAECIEHWEEFILKRWAVSSGRGAMWTEREKRQNMWRKKGYEMHMKLCRCRCSGFLARTDPADVVTPKPAPAQPKKKKASKLPSLSAGVNPHSGITIPATEYVQKSIVPGAGAVTYHPTFEETDSGSSTGLYFPPGFNPKTKHQPSPPLLGEQDFPDALGSSGGANADLPASKAWQHDRVIANQEELVRAVVDLMMRRGLERVSSTDLELLDLMNKLHPDMEFEIADADGLLPWILARPASDLFVSPDGNGIMKRKSVNVGRERVADTKVAVARASASSSSVENRFVAPAIPTGIGVALARHLQFSDDDPYACHYNRETDQLRQIVASFTRQE